MGVINAENNLQFKSSDRLFDRVKKRLRSFDAEGLIDDGDFSKLVKDVLEELGQAVYKECDAVIPVCENKAKMPGNFKYFYAAFACDVKWKHAPSINEQRPWVYQYQTEITRDCDSCCTLNCCDEKENPTKVVIRTFVNGEENNCGNISNFCLLKLSPNVRQFCTEDCPNIFCPGDDEVTLEDGFLNTMFNEGSIYIQYFGLALDKYGLPMIPDNTHIEKAIEYYIYTQLFEEFYWNKEADGIERMLADARVQFDLHMGNARYWAKLPSFQKTINSIRKARSRRKFFYFGGDKTYIN